VVTIEELYKALRAHGASPTQAAGIVGNAVSETGPSTDDLAPDSEMNPEYNLPGCVGLWCWEPEFFNPPRPTGNSVADMNNQIAYLKETGGFDRAFGSTAEEAGRNFALDYERCEFCMSGGEQYIARGNQAAAVGRLAAEHGWDRPPAPRLTYHYERYRKGFEQTAVKRYDHWRVRQGAKRKPHRAWMLIRKKQCALCARRIELAIMWDRRFRKGLKDPWSIRHRRFRHPRLKLRGEGKRVERTT